MDQRSIISLLNRTRLPATACLLVLVGGVGALGFPRPAHAVAGGIIVPAGGIFDPNNANGTFTYTYVQPIAVAPEAGGDELQTPTCTASGATLGSVGLTSFTFNQGTTTVSCTAPEDDAPPDNVPDTGSFTVIVREFPLTFTNPLLSQTKTADATDTATFTVDFATASEPGETAAELFALSGCKTNDFAQTPLINPVTLHTGRHEYLCMATDTTDNNLHPSLVLVALTVLDERTVLRNPGNQTAFANATDTAVVSYPAVTPSEVPSGESDGQLVGCLAPGASSVDGFVSSGTFPVGVTTVSCNANDIPNLPNKDGTNPPGESAPQITFTVTVTDQPVTLTVPPEQVANATSPAGATVTYTPGPVTAVEDGEAEPISLTCMVNNGATSSDGFVASGTFPIGDTTVTCTANDPDGLSAGPQSFTVHVKGAAEQLSDLISLVDSLNLNSGLQTSLDTKLQHALDAVNGADTRIACNLMGAFTNEVQAQSGTMLTVAQANQLLTASTRIQAVLSC